MQVNSQCHNYSNFIWPLCKLWKGKEQKEKLKNWNILITERAFQMKQKAFFIVFEMLPYDKIFKNSGHKF